jgi:hypothetical protein
MIQLAFRTVIRTTGRRGWRYPIKEIARVVARHAEQQCVLARVLAPAVASPLTLDLTQFLVMVKSSLDIQADLYQATELMCA